MDYLDQPRGEGTAYRFRMKTPKSLKGRANPWSGKPFGSWIIRGMNGERHRPTAKKLAQLLWSEVIKLEATYRASDRYSPEKAELWNEAFRTEDDPLSIRDLIYEEVQKAPEEHRKAFSKVALATTPTLTQAVPAYLKAREEGNGYGYAPLAASTVADINSAIAHLSRFLKQPPEAVYLGDLNKDNMLIFRGEYLPSQISKRTGEGLAPATIGKMITMLRGLWHWGQEHKGLPEGATPFDLPNGVRRERPKAKQKRDAYKPEETQKVLAQAPVGELLGDIFRIALVTGARATEIAKVTVSNTKEDGSVFLIDGGKTESAKRVIPVPMVAQSIVLRLRSAALAGNHERLFYMTPLSPQLGNAAALSKRYTIFRRNVLGRKTDGHLDFHSLRHTWRTTAHRAGLNIDDTHDLGGWASVGRTSDPYNHGLNLDELATAQEKIMALMERDGYLKGF